MGDDGGTVAAFGGFFPVRTRYSDFSLRKDVAQRDANVSHYNQAFLRTTLSQRCLCYTANVSHSRNSFKAQTMALFVNSSIAHEHTPCRRRDMLLNTERKPCSPRPGACTSPHRMPKGVRSLCPKTCSYIGTTNRAQHVKGCNIKHHRSQSGFFKRSEDKKLSIGPHGRSPTDKTLQRLPLLEGAPCGKEHTRTNTVTETSWLSSRSPPFSPSQFTQFY